MLDSGVSIVVYLLIFWVCMHDCLERFPKTIQITLDPHNFAPTHVVLYVI